MSEVPFGADGDYSDRAMLACANGFLANALGAAHALLSILLSPCSAPNTAAVVGTHCRIPRCRGGPSCPDVGLSEPVDKELLEECPCAAHCSVPQL